MPPGEPVLFEIDIVGYNEIKNAKVIHKEVSSLFIFFFKSTFYEKNICTFPTRVESLVNHVTTNIIKL